MSDQFSIKWLDANREPQCAPNPLFPDGIDVDTGAVPACKTALPYPAKRCGTYVVICTRCGVSAGITTAGRPDDPRSVKIPCRTMASA